jgi:hypothetical protein
MNSTNDNASVNYDLLQYATFEAGLVRSKQTYRPVNFGKAYMSMSLM